LTARLVSGPELLFLLANNVPSAIYPIFRMLPRLASLFADAFTTFLSLREQRFSRLFPRARCIQNAHDSSNAETRQEPYKTVAVTIRHNFLLVLSYLDGSTRIV
jgi:hypothetical protein